MEPPAAFLKGTPIRFQCRRVRITALQVDIQDLPWLTRIHSLSLGTFSWSSFCLVLREIQALGSLKVDYLGLFLESEGVQEIDETVDRDAVALESLEIRCISWDISLLHHLSPRCPVLRNLQLPTGKRWSLEELQKFPSLHQLTCDLRKPRPRRPRLNSPESRPWIFLWSTSFLGLSPDSPTWNPWTSS